MNSLRRSSTILLPPSHNGWFSRNKAFTIWVLAIAVITPILLVLVLFLPVIVNFFAGDNGAVHKFIQGVGWPAPLVVGVVYIIGTLFIVPAPILALGIALFCDTLWVALVTGYVGALTGACIAFFMGRQNKLRSKVLERFAETPSFLEVDVVMHSGRKKFWMVILLRLSPLMSCCRLNYALAISVLSFPQYLLGSVVGLIPHNTLFVFLCWASVHEFTSTDTYSLFINIYVYGSAATLSIVVVVILSGLARKELADIMFRPTYSSPSRRPINVSTDDEDDDTWSGKFDEAEISGGDGEEVVGEGEGEEEEGVRTDSSFVEDEEKLRNSYQMTRSR